MAKFTTAIIVGSLRKDSLNRKLARAIARLGQERFTASFIEIGDLPLYNDEILQPLPDAVSRFKQAVQNADAVLFVTPEYNRSIPGGLKNAIDWGSRPYGENCFKGKPAAIIGTSPSALGTACAQQHLRACLTCLDLKILAMPEAYVQYKDGMIDENDHVTIESVEKFLSAFTGAFGDWVDLIK